MSIRHGLLALLADRPTHGYGLKSGFEALFAETWPLNVGQVYTTLGRLDRDGLVEPTDEESDDRQAWRITEKGREQLAEWYRSPVDDRPARDELTIKVLLALADPNVDAHDVLQRQRAATLRRLQTYNRAKRDAVADRQAPRALLIDALILASDAEARWLDRCEDYLRHRDGGAA